MITPNTNIRLLKTPFELDELNQLTFASATAQYNFFNGLSSVDLENATFQRKDGVIRFETDSNFTFDDVLSYNYCMYQNTSYGDKWFYAFIEDVRYINDSMSELSIKTDVYQTWQFKMLWNPSFIEREHIAKADDIVGANLLPENVETGEYIVDGSQQVTIYESDILNYYVVLAVTKYPGNNGDNVGGKPYNGVFSGFAYITSDNATNVSTLIQSYADLGKMDAIVYAFLAPKLIAEPITWITETVTPTTGGSYTIKYGTCPVVSTTSGFSFQALNKPTRLGGTYTPVNKKLLTWPYTYALFDNNTGNAIEYHYEDFALNPITFDVEGVLVPGCSYKISPSNYKNKTNSNHLYSFTPSKLPICSWQSDVYTNWLTQNAVNIPVNIIGGVTSILAGIGSKSAAGIAGGINSIADTIGQIYEHKLIPPTVNGNINSGDVNFTLGLSNPIIYNMTIKEQYARIIDDYFSMYGYATHKVKLPNLNNRTNWNYVKTIGANITGDIPQKDLQELKKIFNNGVTLWHNPTTFLDYGQNNN